MRDFLTRYPSILAFGWSQRVLAKDRQIFEQAIRAEGYANFQIQERSSQGKMVRAGERSEYFPVTYTSALSNQNAALGLDLISDSIRRSPLKKAGDTGAMSSTGRIELVTTKQLSFLTYQPIYLNGASLNSLQSRRQNFLGVTTAVFQIADIVKAALPELELDNINFYLFDDSAAAKDRFLSFYQSENQQLVTDINRETPVKIGVQSLVVYPPASNTRIPQHPNLLEGGVNALDRPVINNFYDYLYNNVIASYLPSRTTCSATYSTSQTTQRNSENIAAKYGDARLS